MDLDLIGPDVNAFDQGGEEGTLPCCGQLGPAPADFPGSRHHPVLCCRIGKSDRLVDAAGIDKPLPHAAGHRLLDFPGRDAQAGGPWLPGNRVKVNSRSPASSRLSATALHLTLWLPKIASGLAQLPRWTILIAGMIDLLKLLSGLLVGVFRSHAAREAEMDPAGDRRLCNRLRGRRLVRSRRRAVLPGFAYVPRPARFRHVSDARSLGFSKYDWLASCHVGNGG